MAEAARAQTSPGAAGQQGLRSKFEREARGRLGCAATEQEITTAAEAAWVAHLARAATRGAAVSRRVGADRRPSQLNDRQWLQRAVATRGVREIGADLGVGSSTVHRAVKRLGIDVRAAQRTELVRHLLGKRFGMLVVRGEGAPTRRSGNLRVWAGCDCGGEKLVTIWTLENHGPGWDHCGCQSSARWAAMGASNRTHGHSGSGGRKRATPTYQSWQAMRDRCYRPTTNGYDNFGGRGIKVCDRWRFSFAAFLEDLGERPDGKTLDRRDVDGDYVPSNCRWATPPEQIANRRRSAWLSAVHWETIREALGQLGTQEAQAALTALDSVRTRKRVSHP
jgi:hypothetical protein